MFAWSFRSIARQLPDPSPLMFPHAHLQPGLLADVCSFAKVSGHVLWTCRYEILPLVWQSRGSHDALATRKQLSRLSREALLHDAKNGECVVSPSEPVYLCCCPATAVSLWEGMSKEFFITCACPCYACCCWARSEYPLEDGTMVRPPNLQGFPPMMMNMSGNRVVHPQIRSRPQCSECAVYVDIGTRVSGASGEMR